MIHLYIDDKMAVGIANCKGWTRWRFDRGNELSGWVYSYRRYIENNSLVYTLKFIFSKGVASATMERYGYSWSSN